MSRRIFILVLLVQLGLSFIYLSQREFSESHIVHSQTIPTPTPSAMPDPPTSVPPSPTEDNGGGGGGQPTAASTTPPNHTATPTTAPVTIAPTPDGGFYPTAQPCSHPPTLKAFNTINVRRGPGIAYETFTQIVFLEVRPIVGRAAEAAWWLIQLDDGEQGWVADRAGTVTGYIGTVPIVPAPALNGQTPTPGASWQPTPAPFCTVTPTPPHTPEPTATSTAVTLSSSEPIPAATTISTIAVTPTTVTQTPPPNQAAGATATALSAEAAAVALNATSSATEISSAVLVTAESPPPATAVPLPVEEPAATPNLLPIVGLILLGAGIFIAIIRRRSTL